LASHELVKLIVTGWLAVPTGDVSSSTGAVAYLRGYTAWIVAAVAVGSLLVSAKRCPGIGGFAVVTSS
jgi:hypothetical protein